MAVNKQKVENRLETTRIFLESRRDALSKSLLTAELNRAPQKEVTALNKQLAQIKSEITTLNSRILDSKLADIEEKKFKKEAANKKRAETVQRNKALAATKKEIANKKRAETVQRNKALAAVEKRKKRRKGISAKLDDATGATQRRPKPTAEQEAKAKAKARKKKIDSYVKLRMSTLNYSSANSKDPSYNKNFRDMKEAEFRAAAEYKYDYDTKGVGETLAAREEADKTGAKSESQAKKKPRVRAGKPVLNQGRQLAGTAGLIGTIGAMNAYDEYAKDNDSKGDKYDGQHTDSNILNDLTKYAAGGYAAQQGISKGLRALSPGNVFAGGTLAGLSLYDGDLSMKDYGTAALAGLGIKGAQSIVNTFSDPEDFSQYDGAKDGRGNRVGAVNEDWAKVQSGVTAPEIETEAEVYKRMEAERAKQPRALTRSKARAPKKLAALAALSGAGALGLSNKVQEFGRGLQADRVARNSDPTNTDPFATMAGEFGEFLEGAGIAPFGITAGLVATAASKYGMDYVRNLYNYNTDITGGMNKKQSLAQFSKDIQQAVFDKYDSASDKASTRRSNMFADPDAVAQNNRELAAREEVKAQRKNARFSDPRLAENTAFNESLNNPNKGSLVPGQEPLPFDSAKYDQPIGNRQEGPTPRSTVMHTPEQLAEIDRLKAERAQWLQVASENGLDTTSKTGQFEGATNKTVNPAAANAMERINSIDTRLGELTIGAGPSRNTLGDTINNFVNTDTNGKVTMVADAVERKYNSFNDIVNKAPARTKKKLNKIFRDVMNATGDNVEEAWRAVSNAAKGQVKKNLSSTTKLFNQAQTAAKNALPSAPLLDDLATGNTSTAPVAPETKVPEAEAPKRNILQKAYDLTKSGANTVKDYVPFMGESKPKLDKDGKPLLKRAELARATNSKTPFAKYGATNNALTNNLVTNNLLTRVGGKVGAAAIPSMLLNSVSGMVDTPGGKGVSGGDLASGLVDAAKGYTTDRFMQADEEGFWPTVGTLGYDAISGLAETAVDLIPDTAVAGANFINSLGTDSNRWDSANMLEYSPQVDESSFLNKVGLDRWNPDNYRRQERSKREILARQKGLNLNRPEDLAKVNEMMKTEYNAPNYANEEVGNVFGEAGDFMEKTFAAKEYDPNAPMKPPSVEGDSKYDNRIGANTNANTNAKANANTKANANANSGTPLNTNAYYQQTADKYGANYMGKYGRTPVFSNPQGNSFSDTASGANWGSRQSPDQLARYDTVREEQQQRINQANNNAMSVQDKINLAKYQNDILVQAKKDKLAQYDRNQTNLLEEAKGWKGDDKQAYTDRAIINANRGLASPQQQQLMRMALNKEANSNTYGLPFMSTDRNIYTGNPAAEPAWTINVGMGSDFDPMKSANQRQIQYNTGRPLSDKDKY